MNLVLMGGVHGVGKTTLLEYLQRTLGQRIRSVDPGEYFWRHVYELKDKTADEVEELVVQEVSRLASEPLVVCNWHYAVWQPGGYIPQLKPERLMRLVANLLPDRVYLVLVTASVSRVYIRRQKDRRFRQRKLDWGAIVQEMTATEKFFQLQQGIIGQLAPTFPVIIENHNLQSAQNTLRRLLQQSYEIVGHNS